MSYFGKNLPDISLDAGGRLRTGQLTTLGDLKTLGAEDVLLLENAGTGTATWADNKCTLTVASGQVEIRKSKHYYHYASGKVTQIEMTQDGFQHVAGVVKRLGYFSSNATTPYNTNKDGFWLEDDGVTNTKYLVVSHLGTEVLRVAQANWNGDDLAGYDWSKFTVVLFDFLWLGGAVLRLFVKTGGNFALVHTFNYAGTATNTMTRSPNQTVRWEVRGISDGGSLRPICAQVSTEGSVHESGKRRVIDTGHVGITVTTVGTTYPILALRKKSGFRDRAIKLLGFSGLIESVNDFARFRVHLNPTFSADLTWTDITGSAAQKGVGDGTKTITSEGTLVASLVLATGIGVPPNIFDDDFLTWLGVSIDDVSDTLVLSVTPITATDVIHAAMPFKDF